MRRAAFGRAALLAAAAVAITAAGARAAAPGSGTIMVTLGDGTTMPLRDWALSYEYAAFRTGTSSLAAAAVRKDTADLLIGKRALPTAGQTLTFNYDEIPKALVKAGVAAVSDRLQHVRELVMTGADGHKTTYKVEPPAREALLAGGEKGMSVAARSLDLRGETVTGTRKEFCLLSYTAVVECGGSPADHVVKIEFLR